MLATAVAEIKLRPSWLDFWHCIVWDHCPASILPLANRFTISGNFMQLQESLWVGHIKFLGLVENHRPEPKDMMSHKEVDFAKA